MSYPTLRPVPIARSILLPLLVGTCVVVTILPPESATAAVPLEPPEAGAKIAFEVPGRAGRARQVVVTVHDLAGRRVATLARDNLEPGSYERTWSGLDRRGQRLTAGVFFASVRVDGRSTLRRIVLLD